MKKKMKTWLVLGLVLMLLVSLTACGNGGNSTEDVMKAAQDALNEVSSMRYDMVMDMNMSAGGQTITSTTTGRIAYNADPLAMEMQMTIDVAAQGKVDMLMYAGQDGDNLVMYMNDGTTWGKQTLADASQLEQYKAQDSMSIYLENIDSFKEAGTEQVNDSEATKYEGIIANDALNEVMAASGMEEQLAQYGLTAEDAAAIYQDLGDLSVAIWIDNESKLPVKYEMDMTAMMQNIMTKVFEKMNIATEDMDFTVDKMFISMALYDFDNVGEIAIPEEAKSAPEMNLGV